MENYKNILVSVELNRDTDDMLIDAAMKLVKRFGAKLTLVHAIEHVGSYGGMYGITMATDIEEMLLKNAQQEMEKLGENFGLPRESLIVKLGSAKVLITEEAERLAIDLIVVGSHGRRGLQILLGSTANAVLHRAKCDVLVVRTRN